MHPGDLYELTRGPCMALLRELRGERATSAAIGIQIHLDMRICAYL